MKLKTNKNKNNNHKNMKSKLNNKNKNFKNGTKLRKNKTKSNLRGGFNPNPLKLLSFYFYKLIIKTALLNQGIKQQLDTIINNALKIKNITIACKGKNIKTEIINICINVLQSISIIGFAMSSDQDNYINAKLAQMKTKREVANLEKSKNSVKIDCKAQIIAYLIAVNKQGMERAKNSVNSSSNAPKGDFSKFMGGLANIAKKDNGQSLKELKNDPNISTIFGKDALDGLFKETDSMLNNMLDSGKSDAIELKEPSNADFGEDTMLNEKDINNINDELPKTSEEIEKESLKDENELFVNEKADKIAELEESQKGDLEKILEPPSYENATRNNGNKESVAKTTENEAPPPSYANTVGQNANETSTNIASPSNNVASRENLASPTENLASPTENLASLGNVELPSNNAASNKGNENADPPPYEEGSGEETLLEPSSSVSEQLSSVSEQLSSESESPFSSSESESPFSSSESESPFSSSSESPFSSSESESPFSSSSESPFSSSSSNLSSSSGSNSTPSSSSSNSSSSSGSNSSSSTPASSGSSTPASSGSGSGSGSSSSGSSAVGGTYKKRNNRKSKQKHKSKKSKKTLKNRKSKSNNSKKQIKH